MTSTHDPFGQLGVVPPPLDQPLYGATPAQAIGRFFKKYATFSGRASRSEYWWVYLFIVVIWAIGGIAFGLLSNATKDPYSTEPGAGAAIVGVPLVLFFLASIVPAIALQVRRLHDANLSGLLYLITFFPYLGSFVLLILAILPSSPAGARYDVGAVQPGYLQAPGAYPPAPYSTPPSAAPGYTTAPQALPTPPVQAGPPPQASPPPPVPPVAPPPA